MPLWPRRSSKEAILQRIYDQAYQSSLNSILKETEMNYEASLNSWKRTLEDISEGMASLDGQPTRTGQERSLLSNIIDIEKQCHTRISYWEGVLGHTSELSSDPFADQLPESPPGCEYSGARAPESPPRISLNSSIPRGVLMDPPQSASQQPGIVPPPHGSTLTIHTPRKLMQDETVSPISRVKELSAYLNSGKQGGSAGRTQSSLSVGTSSYYSARLAVQPTKSYQTLNESSALQKRPAQTYAQLRSPADLSYNGATSGHSMLTTLRRGKGLNPTVSRKPPHTANHAASIAWESKSTQSEPAHTNASYLATMQSTQDILMRSAQQAINRREQPHRMRRSPKMEHFQSFSGPLNGDSSGGVISRPPNTRSTKYHISSKSDVTNLSTTKNATARLNEVETPPPQSSSSQESDYTSWDSMAREKIKDIRGIDENSALQILNEVVLKGDPVHWDDIAGLEKAKASLKETVVYPFLRPDLFSGLREPALGMLLFGPPGTGKTMLARAVATESKSTFFSISASSLTSKYMGESEKLVRALFQMAKALAPSIIFVDEIDSILTQRADSGEHEASRRIKNEFFVQWSDLQAAAAGKQSNNDLRRVLVLGATNLPWAIDEAARRRFVRRQYIPLPEASTRKLHLQKLLSRQNHALTVQDIDELVELTDGYSGSDLTALAKDAAMGPLRSLGDALLTTSSDQVRPIGMLDFKQSMQTIRPSVSAQGLQAFEQWAELYGSSGA